MATVRALHVLVFAWAIVSCACGTNKVAQASRDLAADITRATSPQTGGPGPPTPVGQQRVYLDASVSMSGFVNPNKSSKFDELINELGDALPGCQLYKYGQRGAGTPGGNPAENPPIAEPVSFGLELHRPGFYNLSFNPDDQLIQQLADEGSPALSVLITDGVYSEPRGATSPPVVQAIQKWIEKGRPFGILVFRSDFEGPFYTERGRALLPKISIKGRPFYAFVFSPTDRAFRELQEKLVRRFPEMRAILFSDDAVTCVPNLNERLKGSYSHKRPPETPYYWQMFDSSIFDRTNPVPVTYSVTCEVAPGYPVSELAFDMSVEYYRWTQGQLRKVEEGAPPGFRYDPPEFKGEAGAEAKEAEPQANPAGQPAKPAAQPLTVTVYLPKDVSSDYGFYSLRLNASPKSYDPGIRELSTRDDRVEADMGRTFRFAEFISALTDVHFRARLVPKASPAVFMTVNNH